MRSDNDTHRTGRRTFLRLAGAGAAATLLAGCSGGEGGSADGGETEQTEASDGGGDGGGTERTETSDGGDDGSSTEVPEFVWLLVGAVRTLDPGGANDWPTTVVAVNYYDNLITVDSEENRPVANLATDWSVEGDGNTWVFTLRDDVTFHNGDPLTAEDVAYSMNRIMDAKLARSSLWQGFVESGNATARDETTVEIETTRPYGPLLATMSQLFVVNSAVAAENEVDGDWGAAYLGKTVAGSGPYTLPEPLQTGDPEELEFVAYEDYWAGWEDDQFTRARMKKVKEPSTNKSLMRNGDAHMTSPFLSRETYEELDTYEDVTSLALPRPATWHISMHTRKAPTDDIHVRKAIASAFDYRAAIDNIFGGEHAAGPVPVHMFGHNEELEPYTQDLERAREEIERSAYTVEEINEIGLEHVYVSGIERQRKLSLLLKNSLAGIGLEVELSPLPWPQMVDRAANEESTPHTMNLWFGAEFPSPDAFLTLLYHPSNFGSFMTISWFTTDELTTVLGDARGTLDLNDRIEQYKTAQRIVWEHYPGIYIANPPLRIALNRNVGGFTNYGVTGFEGQVHNMFWEG